MRPATRGFGLHTGTVRGRPRVVRGSGVDPVDTLLTAATAGVFVVLSLWHVGMALSRSGGASGAVPSVDGQPLFVPSRRSTLAVALLLLGLAGLVCATGGLWRLPVPRAWLGGLSYAVAAGLWLRAIGDFRFVGFFKSTRDSRFARLDTRVYSPLCVVLGSAVAAVAWRHGGY